jgi:hypothetical protein
MEMGRAMRLPRVRFTIRRLMVAVAVLALLIGADQFVRRSTRYRGRADHFGLLETATWELQKTTERKSHWHAERARSQVEPWGPFDDDQHRASVVAQTKDWVEAGYLRQEAAANAAEADWYSQLRHKYEHAARRPWELLAPDPPRPTVKRPFRFPR